MELMPKGKIKFTKEDRAWATSVKERDGFACVICNKKQGTPYISNKGRQVKINIHAHHILPRELHGTKYDIFNGITLCPKHHFFSREISAHNNPLAFFIWMEINRPEILQYLKEKCHENHT